MFEKRVRLIASIALLAVLAVSVVLVQGRSTTEAAAAPLAAPTATPTPAAQKAASAAPAGGAPSADPADDPDLGHRGASRRLHHGPVPAAGRRQDRNGRLEAGNGL